VIEDDSLVEDGVSSCCESPSSTESTTHQQKANLRQMFIFDNQNDELLTFEDKISNISFGGDSDLMAFSPESGSIRFANDVHNQDNQENFTWQTYEYDDELQTGAATIFYNFEDDSS
jgi:hypothetical protein